MTPTGKPHSACITLTTSSDSFSSHSAALHFR